MHLDLRGRSCRQPLPTTVQVTADQLFTFFVSTEITGCAAPKAASVLSLWAMAVWMAYVFQRLTLALQAVPVNIR